MDLGRTLRFSLLPAALIAVVAWWQLSDATCAWQSRRCGPEPTERSAPTGTPDHRNVPSAARHLPTGPFHRVRGELETRAVAGDGDAAFHLGRTLYVCSRFRPISDSAFDAMLAEVALRAGNLFKIADTPLGDPVALDFMLDAKAEMDRLCVGTAGLEMEPNDRTPHRWVLHAASLGHPLAMATYGDYAFNEFPDTAAVLDHASEVARRRDRARSLLDSALRAHEPAALLAHAKAHDRGGLLEPDGVRALAYWRAYRQTGPGRSMSPAAAELTDRHYRNGLDAQAEAQANALAASLLSRFPGQDAGS